MSTLTKLKENIESVIVGKGKVIDMVMTSLIAGGHILLEDVPGTGKTVMSKSLARSLDASFSRVRIESSSSLDGSPIESFIKKRSSCASGRGNVPVVSTGFCVAITIKGAGRGLVFPSTVT